MPLKVSVGLSKKIGQPDYGSLGASCHVEFELDGQLLHNDLDTFHRHVSGAFVACKLAVQDELSRHQDSQPAKSNGRSHHSNGHSNGNGQAQKPARKATNSQVRALNSIANRMQLNLANWLQEKFGIRLPDELSITQASSAIDELKAAPSGGQN